MHNFDRKILAFHKISFCDCERCFSLWEISPKFEDNILCLSLVITGNKPDKATWITINSKNQVRIAVPNGKVHQNFRKSIPNNKELSYVVSKTIVISYLWICKKNLGVWENSEVWNGQSLIVPLTYMYTGLLRSRGSCLLKSRHNTKEDTAQWIFSKSTLNKGNSRRNIDFSWSFMEKS